MKRTAITRRTPLKRGEPVRWNSTLKATSKRRNRENRERSKVLARLKRRYPMCQRCEVNRSEDGHEPLTRARLGSITDETNIKMLCRPCHRWVHDNPAEATKEGWLISRYAS